MFRKHEWTVIALGLALVLGFAWVASLGDLSRNIPRFLIGYGVLFVLYIASIIVLSRIERRGSFLVAFVFAVALACRLVNLGAEPSLSTDIYRYLWEGKVIDAGFNPFSHPPDAAELEFLRDENYGPINHRHLETIYPPLAQAMFFVGAALEPAIVTQKIIFTLFDLATMAVLLLLLMRRGVNPYLSAIYGWSPLVIVEFSHSGHLDSLGILLLVLGVYFFQSGRRALSVGAVAMSFLAKYLSVLLVPFFLFKGKYARWLILLVVIIAAGYLPFAGASGKLVSSLRVYGENWEFNSLLFGAVQRVIDNPVVIRRVLLAMIVVFAFIQGYRRSDLLRFAYLVIGFSLLLSPTLYPWYVCWIVPFLCFHRSRAWLAFTGLVMLSYTVWTGFHRSGAWELGALTLIAEYVPFYGLLAYESYRGLRRGEPQHS